MAILKCKMCGGVLTIEDESTVCECEYCGTKQTVPKADDEKKITLFERANRLRFNCEFDKAASVYESIVAEFREEAEGYWGLVLCKYGIEYVDDPATGNKVPTCHRSSFDSVMDDADFELVMENADSISRQVYREQAKQIEEIRKGIIEVSGKEQPYDIFICYKETAEDGQRTLDSVLAQDVYEALTDKGYRVFFSRITLEDKLGTEYEPYIFAALNSAKIMLAFGTTYDYYNAVWVKNEWSRFLKLMAVDKSKHLIPCFKDIDAYDIPKEFARLQAQDLGKVGAVQDLLRGIEKILGKKQTVQEQQPAPQVIYQQGSGNNVQALLDRGQIALEDGELEKADHFFEEALNQNAKCAEAYLGKMFVEYKVCDLAGFIEQQKSKFSDAKFGQKVACEEDTAHIEEMVSQYALGEYLPADIIRGLYRYSREYTSCLEERTRQKESQLSELNGNRFLTRARQYAAGDTAKKIEEGIQAVTKVLDDRIRDARSEDEKQKNTVTAAYRSFLEETDVTVKAKYSEAVMRIESVYAKWLRMMKNAAGIADYENIIAGLRHLGDYKNSVQLIVECEENIRLIREKEQEEAERQRRQEELRLRQEQERKKRRMIIIGLLCALVAVAGVVLLLVNRYYLVPNGNYKEAVALMKRGKYEAAITAFQELGDFKDSKTQIVNCENLIKEDIYQDGTRLMEQGEYEQAIEVFTELGTYSDSKDMIEKCETAIKDVIYEEAMSYMSGGEYEKAIAYFRDIVEHGDSQDKITECETAIKAEKYQRAMELKEAGEYDRAWTLLETIREYGDSVTQVEECKKVIYENALDLKRQGQYQSAISTFQLITEYSDSATQIQECTNLCLKNAKKGDEVSFGGKRWIVLDAQNNKKMLISKHCTETRRYHNTCESVTWETCDLRAYLNGTWLTLNFTETERKMIMETSMKNADNSKYGTDGGKDTKDKVFLLSIDEVNKYFGADSDRKALYAASYGSSSVCWWLRSPGYDSECAADVRSDGSVGKNGYYVDNDLAVRPALWIDVPNL